MAILRCNHCALIAEQADGLVGQSIDCPRCGKQIPVYPTIFFVEKLLSRYFEVLRELNRLRAPAGSVVTTASSETKLAGVDLANTDLFANEQQHGPICDWFRKRQIRVDVDLHGVDTSGFFDEVAEAIGANLSVLKDVLERVRWSQQKEHASTTINLERKSPEDARIISDFCQKLYDFSFVAKCFHNKVENNVRLILQTAPTIRRFFEGEWLEWNALMVSLRYAKERGHRFSCARGLELTLPGGEMHELDVFMLIDGNTPVCIECKSGEFRQNIDRYLALKKRLGLTGKQFVMCVAGLDEEKAKAFSAMYDLAFTSERTLAAQLARLF